MSISGRLEVSINDTDKESIVEMLIERLEPYLTKSDKVETDSDGLELLDREEVMKMLHIKQSKMGEIIKSGDLKIIRLNRRILFRKQDIINYLEQNTIN